jgi:formamidopyrimidine-DNA glycosylase
VPEGHTLFRLAREQSSLFAGRPVHVSSPQGRFAAGAALLDGRVLVEVFSYGKHLFARFGGDTLHVHLGLYGTFTGGTGTPPVPRGALRMRWEGTGPDGAGVWADLRGPTVCEVLAAPEVAAILARLGPDPLRPKADPLAAHRRIARSRTAIGALLMDQSVLAGVGNVYRAEVLFRHRMHPLRPGRTLRVGQWRAMWDDLVVLMAEGVETGTIDTVRPEHTPEAMGRPPRTDDHGGEVYVYRRAGQACLVCGSRVRTEVLVGRNLFWCAHCQPRFRSRAVQ